MKEGWKELFFKDFIKLNRGFDLPNNMIEEGEYPVIASTSIKAYHKNFKVKAPCVVTGRSGSLGVVQYVNQDGWPLNTSLYVKDFKGNNPKFVYYFLQTMNLDAFNSGAGVPTLNQNHLHYLKIFIPKDVNHQKRIASILSAYDDLIEVNNKQIELLEQSARELYKEWFVRMRFPNYQNTKFNKGIPVGWEVKSPFEIADVLYGFPFNSKLFNEEGKGISIVRIRDIQRNLKNTFTTEDVNIRYLLEDGDILIGMDGEFYVQRWMNGRAYVNQRVLRLRYIPNSVYCSSFIENVIREPIFFLNSIIVGTTVAHLSDRDLKKIQLLIPSVDLLLQYAKNAEPLTNKIILLFKQNQELTEIRNRLLPRLISGKLEVKS